MFFTFWPMQPQNLIQDAIEAQYHFLVFIPLGEYLDIDRLKEKEDPLDDWFLCCFSLRVRDVFVPLFECLPDPKLRQAIDEEGEGHNHGQGFNPCVFNMKIEYSPVHPL